MSLESGKFPSQILSQVLGVCSAAAVAIALTGCGAGTAASPLQQTLSNVNGKAMGGHQPVSGATVNLYDATTAGYGGAAKLLGTATSGSDGSFSISHNASTCSDPDQLYIVASGGNPGSGTNPASVLVSALGPCSTVSSSTNVVVNELTTVAAAYALAPFATISASSTDISTSTTNTAGLATAFATAANLATPNGYARTATLSATGGVGNGFVPGALLNMLANSLASCVNSVGTGSACTNIEVANNSITPANTWQIALQWAQFPNLNVANVFTNSTAQTTFYNPSLGAQPNDLSLAILYTVGTATAPVDVKIDAAGDVWLSGMAGAPLVELGPTGLLLSPATGYGDSTFKALTTVGGLAIDATSAPTVWVSSSAGSIYPFSVAHGTEGTVLSLPTSYTIGGAVTTVPNSATAVAIDSANDVWYGTTSTSRNQTNVFGEFTLSAGAYTSVTNWTGSPVIAGAATNYGAVYMAINPANNEVIAGVQAAKPVFFQSPYTTAATAASTSAYNAANGVAFSGTSPVINGGGTSSTGNAKINYYTADPTVAPTQVQFGGTAKATSFNGVAMDGAGKAFVLTAPITTTNASSLSVIASSTGTFATTASGAGFTPVDSNGSTAYLNSTTLKNLEIDQAGAVWIANSTAGATYPVIQVLGPAAPTKAPLVTGYAAKP